MSFAHSFVLDITLIVYRTITSPISDVCVETIDSTGRGILLKGVLDSGCITSIVLQQYTNKLTRGDKLKYATYGGTATTSYSTDLQLELIEFSHSKRINFKCQVDTSSTKSPYDIILGSDFLSLLDMVLNYDQGTIHWDGSDIPMKKLGELQDNTIYEAIYFANTQPPLLQDLEECQC